MTVTDHAARVRFDYLLPEELEERILEDFPGVVIGHSANTTSVSLVVSAETALGLLEETSEAVRRLCAMVGNDGRFFELNELRD